MRKTLDIDNDLLAAAREISQVVPNLRRQALSGRPGEVEQTLPSGFRPFASRGVVVTNAVIENLRIIEGV